MNSINVHIDAGRRAEAPCEAYLILDNNDITISFTFADGSGFDTTASMTAVLVTAQGKLPDITFSAGQITVPRLVAADGGTLYVGVSQGNIKTTEAARIRVVPSVYTMAHDRTAPDPENPPDYDALPVAESVSLADEVIITDINAGKRKRATLQLLSDLFGAESGHSPYIGENGNWYEWDAEAAAYVDTETPAQGPQGATGATGATGPQGPQGDSGSFTCVYGVTTWADFAAAVRAGKSIKVRDGTSYGWADVIDLDNGYASFTIIAGEDYATSWCEFYADGGWLNWTGGALADAYYVQTALATKQDKTIQTEIATDGAVTQALDPNKTYVFSGDLTSLTLTLNAPVDGIANIYQVFFKNGSTAVNLLYPATVTFADAAFTPAANGWTELSIQYVYSTTEGGVTTPHYIAYGRNIEEGVQ